MLSISLTGEIQKPTSPISLFLRERFPNVEPVAADFAKRAAPAQTLLPPKSEVPLPYSTIGTAIDYRLGYYFWVTPFRALPAFKAARTFSSRYPALGDPTDQVPLPWNAADPTSGAFIVTRLVRDFFGGLEKTLAEVQPAKRRLNPAEEQRLSRYCAVLALLDERAHPTAQVSGSPLNHVPRTATVDDLLGLVPAEWISDLGQLSWLFYDRHASLLTQRVWLKPKNTWQMVGSTADLLVNGCLIDIKTTLTPRFHRAWLDQMLGYVLLEYDPTHPVGGVGFYLSRQGVLVRWGLKSLFAMLGASSAPLRELQVSFREMLLREYEGSARCLLGAGAMRRGRSRCDGEVGTRPARFLQTFSRRIIWLTVGVAATHSRSENTDSTKVPAIPARRYLRRGSGCRFGPWHVRDSLYRIRHFRSLTRRRALC